MKGKEYKDSKSFNKSLGHLITDITGNKNLLSTSYQLIKDLIYLEKGIVFKVIKGDISNLKDDLEHDIEDPETEEDPLCKDHTN